MENKMDNYMIVTAAEQNIMNAIKAMVTSADFFAAAGFTGTSNKLLEFAKMAINTLDEKKIENDKLDTSAEKLSTEEFDSILSSILEIEIDNPLDDTNV